MRVVFRHKNIVILWIIPQWGGANISRDERKLTEYSNVLKEGDGKNCRKHTSRIGAVLMIRWYKIPARMDALQNRKTGIIISVWQCSADNAIIILSGLWVFNFTPCPQTRVPERACCIRPDGLRLRANSQGRGCPRERKSSSKTFSDAHSLASYLLNRLGSQLLCLAGRWTSLPRRPVGAGLRILEGEGGICQREGGGEFLTNDMFVTQNVIVVFITDSSAGGGPLHRSHRGYAVRHCS